MSNRYYALYANAGWVLFDSCVAKGQDAKHMGMVDTWKSATDVCEALNAADSEAMESRTVGVSTLEHIKELERRAAHVQTYRVELSTGPAYETGPMLAARVVKQRERIIELEQQRQDKTNVSNYWKQQHDEARTELEALRKRISEL